MLTPLIGCLRKKYPALSIYILTFNQNIFDFFRTDSNITAVYNTKKNPVRYCREILSKEFTLLFNPKDHPSTNFLIQTALVRARRKISHYNIYHEGLYDELIRLDANTHESAKNLSLINLVEGSSELIECKPYIPVMAVSPDISRFLKTVAAGRYTGINISTGHIGGHRSVAQWGELIDNFMNEIFVIFSSSRDIEEKRALEQRHKNVLQSPATRNLYEVGEIVKSLKPHCGYIHRGIEKMCEKDTYPQIIHLTDRMDYLSAHINNHGVCMLVEKALEVEVPDRVKYIRTIVDELNRIASHQLWWCSFGMDMGGLTCFFYGLR
ncbi:MAG: hypothetical protein HGA46_10590, partial [Chlorobiaceae bacterium]|nr:hypothetical protein [Chlorobiaceae bacterium]